MEHTSDCPALNAYVEPLTLRQSPTIPLPTV